MRLNNVENVIINPLQYLHRDTVQNSFFFNNCNWFLCFFMKRIIRKIAVMFKEQN